jgi:hypothetical protein
MSPASRRGSIGAEHRQMGRVSMKEIRASRKGQIGLQAGKPRLAVQRPGISLWCLKVILRTSRAKSSWCVAARAMVGIGRVVGRRERKYHEPGPTPLPHPPVGQAEVVFL